MILLYDKPTILTLDSEFSGKSFKKELLSEMDNTVKIFKQKMNNWNCKTDDFIGETIGFKTIEIEDGETNSCDNINKIIYLNEVGVTDWSIILHEVCHGLQMRAGVFDCSEKIFSSQLMIEQQCESMAFMLMRKLFNEANIEDFMAYFKKEDVLFLANWFDGYLQMDLKLHDAH